MNKKTRQRRRKMTAVELSDEVRRAAKAKAALSGQSLRDYLSTLIQQDLERSSMSKVLRTETSPLAG